MSLLDRRDFFQILTTGGAGLATGACGRPGEQLIPLLVSDREIVSGEEQWHPAACGGCPAGCGVIARLMEGERVIERDQEKLRQRIACIKKLEGNPLDPVSGGRLCALGQAQLQGLYNPDRLAGPLRRTGPKGRAELAPMSWEEALLVAAEKLTRARQKDPASILFVTAAGPGSRAMTIARFLQALGAPPAASFEIADFPLERRAAELVLGWSAAPVYDLAEARYVLGVGADFLGGWLSPVYYARQYGHFRQGRPGIRGRVVQAESRFSLTAASADEWLPLQPGTEVWLLAALGRLLLEGRSQALPPPVAAVFQGVDVDRAAQACGVDANRLRRVAQELGASEAPLVIAGASAVHTNSLDALVAAGYLNLLLGSVGRPGGVLAPAVEPPAMRPAFTNFLERLERAQFVFLDGANPAYTLPASSGIHEKLAKVETLVSFSPYVDDSAAYADLVLPDHHPLEGAAALLPAVAAAPSVLVATPFVEPLHDTRATEQVLAELAKQVAAPFQPVTPRAAAQAVVPPDQPWEEITRRGGWWADPSPPSPPGRRPPLPPRAAAFEVSRPLFAGSEAEYPLHFQPYLSLQYLDGRGANLPWMQELPDPASSAMWGLPVEIDTKTAARLGIRTGDLVRVVSPHGSLEAPAYVHPAAMPGVLSMAIGEGHRHYGRYASGRGANPIRILAPVWEKSTGALVLGATRVRLERLGPRAGLIQFSPNDREHGPWAHR